MKITRTNHYLSKLSIQSTSPWKFTSITNENRLKDRTNDYSIYLNQLFNQLKLSTYSVQFSVKFISWNVLDQCHSSPSCVDHRRGSQSSVPMRRNTHVDRSILATSVRVNDYVILLCYCDVRLIYCVYTAGACAHVCIYPVRRRKAATDYGELVLFSCREQVC